MTIWSPRLAQPADLPPLAELWHRGWHEAHANITPPALVALRRPDLFVERLARVGDRLRVAGPAGAPMGLCIVKGDHLDQLYVAAEARGTGLAARLLNDGEDRLAAAGVRDAILDCAAGNLRAARFYTREGWFPREASKVRAEAIDPPLLIDVILFTKRLVGASEPHESLAP